MMFKWLLLLNVVLLSQVACDLQTILSEPVTDDTNQSSQVDQIETVQGEPTQASQDIYQTANLKKLCQDDEKCLPAYELLPEEFMDVAAEDSSEDSECHADFDPNLSSQFNLKKVIGTVNGLELFLSKADLFFLAWVSVRYQLNPYFLLGLMAQESRGKCAAVSPARAEGCFQITNHFGKAQLEESYFERTQSWHWSDRSSQYYPEEFFISQENWFGKTPTTDQFRTTIDPTAPRLFGEDLSSVVNYHFGILAAGFYLRWQAYHLYHIQRSIRDSALQLIEESEGKGKFQLAAYNGGIGRTTQAIKNKGNDFLTAMRNETQNYVEKVFAYCRTFQNGTSDYQATYQKDDIFWIIDLLAMTYPQDSTIEWEALKTQLAEVFFTEENTQLNFADDIKALIYVISTYEPKLAPIWPEL